MNLVHELADDHDDREIFDRFGRPTQQFWIDRTAHALVSLGRESLSDSEEAALAYNSEFFEAVMQRVRKLDGGKLGVRRMTNVRAL